MTRKSVLKTDCMATPGDIMSSLSLSHVTNGRATGDYAESDNFNVGPGSLLWAALGLKPSKDNFWTYYIEPHEKGYHPHGPDLNSTDVHAISAIMSCGPVGISDRAGYSNKTLIMRTCRADGRLLQPKRPITAINEEFIYQVFHTNGSRGLSSPVFDINVWSTEFGPYNSNGDVEIVARVVYALNMQASIGLSYNSLTPSLDSNKDYIVRNWYNYTNCKNGTLAVENNCIQYVKANSKIVYNLVPQPVMYPMLDTFELIHILDNVSMSSLVFLGELDKYVSVSQYRFENLVINGMSLSIDIKGQTNEEVNVSVLKPNSQETDFNIYTYQVSIGESGTTTFKLNL